MRYKPSRGFMGHQPATLPEGKKRVPGEGHASRQQNASSEPAATLPGRAYNVPETIFPCPTVDTVEIASKLIVLSR